MPLLLCYYSSWSISNHPPIPVILRAIHSRRHPRTQGPLFLLIFKENPGNEVARGSAIHVFQSSNSMHVSPAEVGHHRYPLPLTSSCLYISSSSSPSNMINTTGCYVNRFSSSTRHSASPDSCFISLEKGAKAASKFSDGSDQIKVELPPPPPFSPILTVLTDAYFVHLIRYKTFIRNFPLPASIRSQTWIFLKLKVLQCYFPEKFRCNLIIVKLRIFAIPPSTKLYVSFCSRVGIPLEQKPVYL